jgi:WhiB family transcriptional regulator, redox-sensing transcriptional regulator
MNRNPRPGAAAEASRPDLDWQENAACRGEDPDLFFATVIPDGAGLKELAKLAAAHKRRESKARRICAACPVRSACLEWRLADEHQLDGGIWGGLDEQERWRLRKRRIRSAAAKRRQAA